MEMVEVTQAQEVATKEINPALKVAQDLQVVGAESMEQAVAVIHGIKEGKGKIEETFKGHVQAAHKAHKDLLATVKKFTAPIDEAEKMLRGKIESCAKESGVTVKGVSIKSKFAITEFPGEDGMIEIMKLIVKGKLPAGLVNLDSKTALELAKAGVDIPGIAIEDVKSLTIR